MRCLAAQWFGKLINNYTPFFVYLPTLIITNTANIEYHTFFNNMSDYSLKLLSNI